MSIFFIVLSIIHTAFAVLSMFADSMDTAKFCVLMGTMFLILSKLYA